MAAGTAFRPHAEPVRRQIRFPEAERERLAAQEEPEWRPLPRPGQRYRTVPGHTPARMPDGRPGGSDEYCDARSCRGNKQFHTVPEHRQLHMAPEHT